MADEIFDLLVIGGGPAGLRSAELGAADGFRTLVADRMPSVGRKFLVAGRGGLNLTHSEAVESFPARYGGDSRWTSLLRDLSPGDLRDWAKELGVETFVGTSGRVFPTTKQAAPLLRRWIKRLREQNVEFRMRHEWMGFRKLTDGNWRFDFQTPDGISSITSRAVILALGGGSWPQTGSDGAWTALLQDKGVEVMPLAPANSGYEVAWPTGFLAEAEGQPIKNIVVRAGEEAVPGELLVTRYGLEGGALYQLGRTLRGMVMPRITLDLKPTSTVEQLIKKLGQSGTGNLVEIAIRVWKLSTAPAALLRMNAGSEPAEVLAERVKSFEIKLIRPRPLAEAISSVGGVCWAELTEELMVMKYPGIFCAGEMVDWDAPTGGYLMQGCFSTATRAAVGVGRYLKAR